MENKYSNILKKLKLKITPKRLEILSILDSEQNFKSPEEIWKLMKKKFKKIGLPTVYRNLEELAEGGVIFRIIHPDRQLYYYFCNNNNHHHHFVCLSCKRVCDIDYCPEKEVVDYVGKKINGTITSHIFQINGICHVCMSTNNSFVGSK